eukprot:TRINITY_DN5905_c0_g1_i1.p1 TRINITY_DN5905_c0_g1~~TRINITY_DN5905_c0_g1_i1.p1  ORF type:complete len:230 (+),score=47.79 TRINITY_DN5905_c0_g1_i1:515-1204(+)
MALQMPKVSSSAAAAVGERPAKKRPHVEGAEDAAKLPLVKQVEKLVVATAKLSLNSAQKSRAHGAAVSETYIIPEDGDIHQAVRKGGADYHALSQDVPVDERPLSIGLPHMYSWSELLGCLIKEGTQDDKTKMEQYVSITNTWQSNGVYWQRLDEQVTIVRVMKAFAKGKKKLEIQVTPGTESRELWVHVMKPLLIKQKGVTLKMGQAPRGAQELAVQALLEQVEGKDK